MLHGLVSEAANARQRPCAELSSLTATRPALVRPSSVLSPRSAHSRILLAMWRRAQCSSAPAGRVLQARSRATSILARVRELKLSAIMRFLPLAAGSRGRTSPALHSRSGFFRGSSALGKKYALQVSRILENAGSFH